MDAVGEPTQRMGVAVEAPEELVAFCTREHPRLVGALTLVCGQRALAEELAQDALVKACERWEQVSQMAAPGAWVHRVAINGARSRFRRRGAERRALQRVGAEPTQVGRDVDATEVLAIRESVAALPARQAQALVLRYYLQLSVAETAEWMQVSPAAVKSLTQRAMAELRGRLGAGATVGTAQEVDDVAP